MDEMTEKTDRTIAPSEVDGLAPPEGSVADDAWPSTEAAPDADANATSATGASPNTGPPAAETVVPTPGRPPADPRSFVGPESTPARGLRNPPIPSVAAINGHPIHPMLVPLPIGALAFALASDLAYVATRDRFWARSSAALIGAGIVTGALAGSMGATDFAGREQIREKRDAWLHAGGNVAALGLSAVNLLGRRRDPAAGVIPTGLAMSLVTALILLLTGWLGGELSYRHRVGVTPD
jgi:uncharacterized membrane protein